MGVREWVGWLNFKVLLFESDVFWVALCNNVFLMLVLVVVVLLFALVLVYVLYCGIWGAGVFRVVLLFFNLFGGIVVVLLWMMVYELYGGFVNVGFVVLGDVLGLDWLCFFVSYLWFVSRIDNTVKENKKVHHPDLEIRHTTHKPSSTTAPPQCHRTN
jgi:ABC-type sugar transport systems, permease components